MSRLPTGRVAAAGATAAAVAAAVFGPFTGATTPAASVDETLPLLPLPVADVSALEDGYHHYVVRLAASAPTAGAPADGDDGTGAPTDGTII